MKKNLILLPLLGTCAAVSSLQGSVLLSESFIYGTATDDIENVSNWVTGSNVVLYDHATNLSTAGLADTVGGSLFHDFASGNRGGTDSTATANPFPTAGEGDEFWIAGMIQANNLDGNSIIRFTNSQTVNYWGFGFDGTGNVLLVGSDNGAAANATTIDTGVDLLADGSTYLFLSRATLGAGTSPTASTIDFWFNPSDISSVAALGTPTFSTGADSKIGRDTGAFTGISVYLAFGNRADGIVMSDSLDSIAVPEPATYALLLGFLALGGVMLRRRLIS
jgi:hypothetical protein